MIRVDTHFVSGLITKDTDNTFRKLGIILQTCAAESDRQTANNHVTYSYNQIATHFQLEIGEYF